MPKQQTRADADKTLWWASTLGLVGLGLFLVSALLQRKALKQSRSLALPPVKR